MRQRARVLPAVEIILTKQSESVAALPGFMSANPAVKPILIGENALARKRNPHVLQQLTRKRNLNTDYNMPPLSFFEVPSFNMEQLKCFDRPLRQPSKTGCLEGMTIQVDEF